MANDLLTRKITYGFGQLDVDRDGSLTEQDHALMGQRSAAELGHRPGSAEERAIIEGYCRIWQRLHKPSADAEGRISGADFLQDVLTASRDRQLTAHTIGRLAEDFFDVADDDGNGVLDPREYRAFIRGHSTALDESEIHRAFAYMDADGDGTISRAELVTAIVDFWTGTEPDGPGSWFLGDPKRYA